MELGPPHLRARDAIVRRVSGGSPSISLRWTRFVIRSRCGSEVRPALLANLLTPILWDSIVFRCRAHAAPIPVAPIFPKVSRTLKGRRARSIPMTSPRGSSVRVAGFAARSPLESSKRCTLYAH